MSTYSERGLEFRSDLMKHGKKLQSLWWRWREIKQTKTGRAYMTVRVNPYVHGNPKQKGRPGGALIEKCGGKTGCKLCHPKTNPSSQRVKEADSKR